MFRRWVFKVFQGGFKLPYWVDEVVSMVSPI